MLIIERVDSGIQALLNDTCNVHVRSVFLFGIELWFSWSNSSPLFSWWHEIYVILFQYQLRQLFDRLILNRNFQRRISNGISVVVVINCRLGSHYSRIALLVCLMTRIGEL